MNNPNTVEMTIKNKKYTSLGKNMAPNSFSLYAGDASRWIGGAVVVGIAYRLPDVMVYLSAQEGLTKTS